MKNIIWVVSVCLVAVGVMIYLILGDAQKSIPKIKLSYFVNEVEIAESITKRLQQEISKQNDFWVGIEPEKFEQVEVALQLKNELEKQKAFEVVVIDHELRLPQEWQQKFKATEVVALKEDLVTVGALLSDLEKKGQRYFVLTASIYSNSLIKKNQINLIKEKHTDFKPMTFSVGYFPVTPEKERNLLFPCSTDDHSGTSDWGCAVVNKSRQLRRRFDEKNLKLWSGAMDLIGENDYMLLIHKK